MHRSPLSVLVIFAAVTACSTGDASAATELLAKDATLVARLVTQQAPRELSLPDACGTVAVAARPAQANLAQAEELARRGYDAETLGNLEEARSLLSRASELDGTNEGVAYHLGRTHEALGDRAGAVAAYCRLLALSQTTTESAEARERVARLSQPEPQVAAGGVSDTAPAAERARATPPRRVTRRRSTVRPRVVASSSAAPSRVSSPRVPSSRGRDVDPASAGAAVADVSSSSGGPASNAPGTEGAADRTASAGDVVAAGAQGSAVAEPSTTASRASTGGLSRTQRAGIGAAAGAIIGAVTGRSVKGALIGAAAGGVLGGVVGGGSGPAGRGIFPAGRGIRP